MPPSSSAAALRSGTVSGSLLDAPPFALVAVLVVGQWRVFPAQHDLALDSSIPRQVLAKSAVGFKDVAGKPLAEKA